MRIRPIYHSGFLLEADEGSYIFDYYQGELPELDVKKPVTVLSSHAHHDHYNPEIFTILRRRGAADVTAVLSHDIPEKRYPEGIPVISVKAGQTYSLPHGERLETLLSTDEGVAFLLTLPEGTVYHAGDLNDWTWDGESDGDNRQMRGSYRHEIDKLAGRRIDVAFVPLDPRQEMYYADGMTYFLEKAGAARVYPMHTWGQPETILRFLNEYPQYRGTVLDEDAMKKEESL